MKLFKIKTLILATVFLIAATAFSWAVDLKKKTFGIGFIGGEPTGISIKTWTEGIGAVDLSAGWSSTRVEKFSGQIDLLNHNFEVFQVESGQLPYYTGIGTRFLVRDPDDGSQETHIGIRLVGGLSYIFDDIPTELFFELGPVLDLVPSTEFDITGGIGGRYYF